MLDWAALQWPTDVPRSIGVLATRVSAPLSDELRSLSNASYGPGEPDWDGAALAKAIRSFAVLKSDDEEQQDLLPPLMPDAG